MSQCISALLAGWRLLWYLDYLTFKKYFTRLPLPFQISNFCEAEHCGTFCLMRQLDFYLDLVSIIKLHKLRTVSLKIISIKGHKQ